MIQRSRHRISHPVHVLSSNEIVCRDVISNMRSQRRYSLRRQQRRRERPGEISHGLDIGFRGTRVIPPSTICRTASSRNAAGKGDAGKHRVPRISRLLRNGLHSTPAYIPGRRIP